MENQLQGRDVSGLY